MRYPLSNGDYAEGVLIVDTTGSPSTSGGGSGGATSALQTTGNTYLSTIAANTPSLGQALAASSVPVVLTAAQITTLTPPSSVGITGTVSVSASSLPLPSGAATASNQATANTSLASIATNTANIPALGQALAASSVPVVLTAAQVTTLTPPTSVGITGSVSVSGLMPAGTDYYNVGTAVSSNLKASSGNVYAITCSNQTTALVWFQLFNKATAPANGDTPVRSYPVYGATSTAPGFIILGQDSLGGSGISFSTGIGWAISSTATTLTLATASATNFITTVRYA